MSDVIRIDRALPARVRLLDRGNNFVCWLEAAEARRLMERGEVETLGSRRKIRALRWVTPRAEEEAVPRRSSYVIRRRGYGDSHCRETTCNPRGVWTIEEVRQEDREVFRRVVDECLAA